MTSRPLRGASISPVVGGRGDAALLLDGPPQVVGPVEVPPPPLLATRITTYGGSYDRQLKILNGGSYRLS